MPAVRQAAYRQALQPDLADPWRQQEPWRQVGSAGLLTHRRKKTLQEGQTRAPYTLGKRGGEEGDNL